MYDCVVVVLSGPPTDVGIDFFVQTFGPLDEVAMVSELAAHYRSSTMESYYYCSFSLHGFQHCHRLQ